MKKIILLLLLAGFVFTSCKNGVGNGENDSGDTSGVTEGSGTSGTGGTANTEPPLQAPKNVQVNPSSTPGKIDVTFECPDDDRIQYYFVGYSDSPENNDAGWCYQSVYKGSNNSISFELSININGLYYVRVYSVRHTEEIFERSPSSEIFTVEITNIP